MKNRKSESENRAYIYVFQFHNFTMKPNAVFVCRKGALNSPLSQTKDGRDLTLSSPTPNPLNFTGCETGFIEAAL